MRETFCFPGYGCPTEIAAVQIKPQWQTTQLEDSLRLTGIYHITAHVRFDFQDIQAHLDNEELVRIDALDIQGDTGYFEYAVPLNVDLPIDSAVEDLMVKDIRPTLTNQMCQLEWAVTSIFNEPEPAFEKARVLEEKPAVFAASTQEEKSTAVAFSAHGEKSAAVVASTQREKPAPVEQKIVLKESSSHIVVRESSSWYEAPSMIWNLTEDYTPLKVRISNDIIQK
ncbi:valyl-tRNA synthetase [Lysinibacillus sp. NPDC097231]|uniref:valyl-tRNA synthetase n=1 Tax=Lysinibacillus sp. NPDC097231 TaxID=3364142 RepID=UPI00382BEAA3